VYDNTIRLDIKVLNETLTGPVSGVKTSQGDFEKRVRGNVDQMRSQLQQCGIDVVIDRIVFIPDPNGANGVAKTTRTCGQPTSDELNLLTAPSRNNKALNIYYINHWLELIPMSNPPQYQTSNRIAAAFSNDCFTINNQTEGGLIYARFGASPPGGPLQGVGSDIVLGHDGVHFYLNNFIQPGSVGEHLGPSPMNVGCGNDPDEYSLMHGEDCRTNFTLSPAECVNMKTNGDESLLMEGF
jgi:hypothetical protein